ncbi:ejection protein [Pseudanabaena phage Pan3]|nr:ejection protein [Pseudanabaena phage Pan3]
MGIATAIGAVASIGGALLSSKSQKSAANKAASVAQDNTAANNALARDIYSQNQQALSPFQQRGNAAGEQINALLGLPSGAPARPQAMGFSPFGGQSYNSMFGGDGPMLDMNTGLPIGVRDYGSFQLQGQPMQPTATAAAPTNPQAGFDAFRNSTGYQFRLNEGNRAIGANFAARGLNNSGAAVRSAMQYGQNLASGEFGNYMNMLFNQQNVGLSGASAQAGVGTNYVNTVTGNNNAGASVAANAALARGNANSMLYGGIANTIGNVFGSSFGFGR